MLRQCKTLGPNPTSNGNPNLTLWPQGVAAPPPARRAMPSTLCYGACSVSKPFDPGPQDSTWFGEEQSPSLAEG